MAVSALKLDCRVVEFRMDGNLLRSLFSLKTFDSRIGFDAAEVEELSGRLKASRQRVTDLERNFSSANTSSQKNEKVRFPICI